MAKYSFEFKLEIVQAYLNGKGGYVYLCRKYNIPDTKILRGWIAAYNTFGEDGLLRSRKKQTYTFNFKLHVVELYLTTEVSCQELALQVGVNNPAMLCKWINDYRIAGPDALKPKRKGRQPKMTKSHENKPVQEAEASTDSEYLKQLEEENLKLRIENAYLKELRRLRLEGKPQNKKRE
jgi:transposase